MTESNSNEEVAEDKGAAEVERDIRKLKYPDTGVETTDDESVEDEPVDGEEQDDEIDQDTEGDDSNAKANVEDNLEEDGTPSDEPPAFVKEFPNIKGDTPEEYAKNLEIAYKKSTDEAMRLLRVADAAKPTETAPTEAVGDNSAADTVPPPSTGNITPEQSWVSKKMDEEIFNAFEEFKTDYPQVADPDNYENFKNEVSTFSATIMERTGQLPNPTEVYRKAAISLGWEKQSVPSEKEKLGMALKTNAGTGKVSSPGAKLPERSKVTADQIAAYRKLSKGGASMSDADIKKKLEAHV